MPDQTEDKLLADLESVLAETEPEEPATTTDTPESDTESDGEAQTEGDEDKTEKSEEKEDEKPAVKEKPAGWKEEWKRTYNPHVLPEDIRDWVLNHQRGLTKVRDRLDGARSEYERKLEELSRNGGKATPAEDAPPALGEDIDPHFVENLDKRTAWAVKQALKSLGVTEKLKAAEETTGTLQRQHWADSVAANMRAVHGMTPEIESVVMEMFGKNPALEVMFYSDEGQADLVELAASRIAKRSDKTKEAESLKHKAAAGKRSTMRPGEGVRRVVPVEKTTMSDEEIAAKLAEEYGIPLR